MMKTTAAPSMCRQFVWRSRWAAFGAAVAVSLGAGAVVTAHALGAQNPSTSYVPMTPCRLLDTRASAGIGGRTTPLGSGETYKVHVTGNSGNCIIPSSASAVAANVTTLDGTAASYLTIWPGGSLTNTSTNNWIAGQPPTPNKVDGLLSEVGDMNVYNFTGTVNVIIDVVGYYELLAPGSGQPGPQGPAGVAGSQGPAGPQGSPAPSIIPSGKTVIGAAGLDTSAPALGEDFGFMFNLPTPPPVPISSVRFGASAFVTAAYVSNLCTGTISAPTAPPGMVCIYLSTLGNVKNISADDWYPFSSGAVLVTWFNVTAGDTFLYVSWAYTAP